MDTIFIVPVLAVIIFVAAKYVEMRFMDIDKKPLKLLARDTIIVFASTIIANVIFANTSGSIMDLFSVITAKKAISGHVSPEVFTDVPGF